MPVDMTMQEPRSRVVSHETDCNIVGTTTDADGVTARRVRIVVCRTTGGTNDVEGMAVQMEGVLDEYIRH